MRILNIYGQPMEHMPVKIVGNRLGLLALKDALEAAILAGQGKEPKGVKAEDCIFATDGEGYSIRVICHDWDFADKRWQVYPCFYHRVLE